MDTQPFIDFASKRVLVTGASSGIGRAIALELSRRNANLIISGRDHDRLDATFKLLAPGRHLQVPMDLALIDDIVKRLKSLVVESGRLYGMCHAAGTVETRPLSSCKPAGLRAMLEINLTAGLELARGVCRRDIMEEDGGALLFISSVYSHVGMPGEIGYSATKGAVTAAARAMAMELARRKIRVNTVSPGLVHTAMTERSLDQLSKQHVQELEDAFPLGAGTPEDVARAAVFLLAPQNTWITGTDLVVDGGFTAR